MGTGKLDSLGAVYTQDRLLYACESRAAYQTDHGRRLLNLHGVFPLSRAYYHCRACEQGYCPLDQVLGLDKVYVYAVCWGQCIGAAVSRL